MLNYIESDVSTALVNCVELTKICKNKIYPLKVPQGVSLPAVVYHRIFTGPLNTLLGYASERVLMQISSYSLNFGEVKRIASAVRHALEAPPLNGVFEGEHDHLATNGDVYVVSTKFYFLQRG